MHHVHQLQNFFEGYLRKQKFNEQPRNLFEPFRYILQLPAKRLRPTMVLLACEMFGTDGRKALPQAFAVELFHNFTLIHDDIMDRAPLRRGKPTVHNKYGETIAILSGDVMLVFAYEYLVQADVQLVPKLVQVLSNCAVDVCRGQQFDMNFESEKKVSLNDYMKMIELKT
ncbi:MAG: polyprenyl synthetase family protein, partial [Chitinophagales bacterium]